jgi:hypothetical protein
MRFFLKKEKKQGEREGRGTSSTRTRDLNHEVLGDALQSQPRIVPGTTFDFSAYFCPIYGLG